jgi:hypothetical protein
LRQAAYAVLLIAILAVTGAAQQQRDCLVVQRATVTRKVHGTDPEDYRLETAVGSETVDEDFFTVVRVGDEVELASYDGRIIRMSVGGLGSQTGAYTDAVDGCLIFLGTAVTLLTVAVLLTVTVHRRGDFEGMLLLWALFLAPLSTMVCGAVTQPHLRAAVGVFGAAVIGCVVLAAVTATLLVWAINSIEPRVFGRRPRFD